MAIMGTMKAKIAEVIGSEIQPVFICGHPKAGTSLLRSLLDDHPQLITYPEETLFFRRYLPQAAGKTAEEKQRLAEELIYHIFEWNTEKPPVHQAGYPDRDYADFVSFERVKEAANGILAERFDHDGDVLFASVMGYGLARNLYGKTTRWWVEKSPYNENFYDQISTWWPGAKCIHITRDPRDNYASYQHKHSEWTPGFFAENWRASTARGLENRDKAGEAHYWVLRYEDLVLQPEETIAQICAFLDIKDDPTLRVPTRAGVAWRGNSMFAERFNAISATPIGRWKKDLSLEEVFIIQEICKGGMAAMGYAREVIAGKDVSLAARAEVAKRRVKGLLGR